MLSTTQKIILILGAIAFAVRALTYHPYVHGGGRSLLERGPVVVSVNVGIILQCIAIIILTATLVFVLRKNKK